MQDGDISNLMSPRIAVVWEHLIYTLPPDEVKAEDRLIRRKRWARALKRWEEDRLTRSVLLDILFRQSVPVDIVCFHPEPFSQRARSLLEDRNYPFSRMYSSTLPTFAQELAYMPEIEKVFYCDPRYPFAFGSRGVSVTSAADIKRFL